MNTNERVSKPRADGAPIASQLTAVSVCTSGQLVLTSASGDFLIDTVNGVIHANVSPPATVSNGGPDANHQYVLRGTDANGSPVALVGLAFIGETSSVETSSGTYRFSQNMSRRESAAPTPDTPGVTTPITNLRIAQLRPNKFVGMAPTGTYFHALGSPSQVIADDVVLQPGQRLVKGKLYSIAANGMPTTMNLQFDHEVHVVAPPGTLSVFYATSPDEDDSSA